MMFRKLMTFCSSILLVFTLAACATAASTPETMSDQKPTEPAMAQTTSTMVPKSDDMKPTDSMMKPTDSMMEPTKEMMLTHTPQDSSMGSAGASGDEMMAANWLSAELTHPVSGEIFTINDFKGQVVLVEPFAQWCSTCLAQQKQLASLYEALGMDAGVVLVGLDIDPNEDSEMLKAYLAKNGFSWNYAIAPKDVAREISDLYGDQFLNPPSAPMLLVDRKGTVHALPFGIKSADQLTEILEPFLQDDM